MIPAAYPKICEVIIVIAWRKCSLFDYVNFSCESNYYQTIAHSMLSYIEILNENKKKISFTMYLRLSKQLRRKQ